MQLLFGLYCAVRYGPMRDGFDAEVMMCPGHVWGLEDRTPEGTEPSDFYLCQVCRHCRAIRCDSGAGEDRCIEARHHVLLPHRLENGWTWPVGMDPKDGAKYPDRWHL
jgi:NAD-dependent dihydropyrimidine dehydrogenase PreA subunit